MDCNTKIVEFRVDPPCTLHPRVSRLRSALCELVCDSGHVTQKWRSVSAAPRRPARAQHARLTRRSAPAREHAPRDPVPCTASHSHGPHSSTGPCIRHLAQRHTHSLNIPCTHTPYYLPSGGDSRLAGEIKQIQTCASGRTRKITSHTSCRGRWCPRQGPDPCVRKMPHTASGHFPRRYCQNHSPGRSCRRQILRG